MRCDSVISRCNTAVVGRDDTLRCHVQYWPMFAGGACHSRLQVTVSGRSIDDCDDDDDDEWSVDCETDEA